MTASDETARQALSDAGAICGQCEDTPGDRTCPECEDVYREYVKALRAAGWAPRSEVLREADAAIEDRACDADFTEEPALIVGLRSAGDIVRRLIARPAGDDADGPDTDPTPLRWGLNDVEWVDDGSTIVLLSDQAGWPYVLELEPERATALRDMLAGPEDDDEDESGPCDCGEGAVHYTRADCPAEQRRAAAPMRELVDRQRAEDGGQ